MSYHRYPQQLQKLIASLQGLPGVGRRTAERYAFHLIEWSEERRSQLAQLLTNLGQSVIFCPLCGAFAEPHRCLFCSDRERKESRQLCIVAKARDLFFFEETGAYRGLYHVLGVLLSPLDAIDEAELRLPHLIERIERLGIEEVILALDASLEGDATALYLKEQLEGRVTTISRLAFGMPMGSSIGHVDGGTLARAFLGRSQA